MDDTIALNRISKGIFDFLHILAAYRYQCIDTCYFKVEAHRVLIDKNGLNSIFVRLANSDLVSSGSKPPDPLPLNYFKHAPDAPDALAVRSAFDSVIKKSDVW